MSITIHYNNIAIDCSNGKEVGDIFKYIKDDVHKPVVRKYNKVAVMESRKTNTETARTRHSWTKAQIKFIIDNLYLPIGKLSQYGILKPHSYMSISVFRNRVKNNRWSQIGSRKSKVIKLMLINRRSDTIKAASHSELNRYPIAIEDLDKDKIRIEHGKDAIEYTNGIL